MFINQFLFEIIIVFSNILLYMSSFSQRKGYHSNRFPTTLFASPTRSYNTNYNMQCDTDNLQDVYTDNILQSPLTV